MVTAQLQIEVTGISCFQETGYLKCYFILSVFNLPNFNMTFVQKFYEKTTIF